MAIARVLRLEELWSILLSSMLTEVTGRSSSIGNLHTSQMHPQSFWFKCSTCRFVGVKKEVVGEGTHFMIPWVQRPIIYDIRARCYCLTYSVLGKTHVGFTGRRTCLPSLGPRISRMLTLPSGFSSGVLICNTDWVTISKEHVSREEIEDDDDDDKYNTSGQSLMPFLRFTPPLVKITMIG